MAEPEQAVRLALQHLVGELGFWPYHPPDDSPAVSETQWKRINALLETFPKLLETLQEILKPPSWKRENIEFSRPDIYCLNPRGYTAVIEVKWIEPKTEVEPWFDPARISDKQRSWLDTWTFEANGHGFIGIATAGRGKRMWLIPWERWVEMEKRLREKEHDFRITIPDLEWCGYDYELDRNEDNSWKLRTFHPLLGMATESSSPKKVDWDKQYSFRFKEKKEAK